VRGVRQEDFIHSVREAAELSGVEGTFALELLRLNQLRLVRALEQVGL